MVELIRSGEALRMLFEALTSVPHLDLVRKVTLKEIGAHELLWQANALAFLVQAYRRESGVRAEVRLLGDASLRKFKGDHLVPVRDLLANEVIIFPTLAREEISRFIETVTQVQRHGG